MTVFAAGGLLSRFAHLTGGVAAKGKAEDDDKDKPEKDKEEATEDDDEDKRDASADDEGDDASADEEGDEDEDEDKKPGKDDKSKAKAKAHAIRKAERARCAAIFALPAAAHNTALAAELAFNTNLTPAMASTVLGERSRAVASLSQRMAQTAPIRVGAEPASDQPKTKFEEARALASSIIASARASGVIRK